MLSDDELLAQLETLSRLGRRLDAKVIVLLIQVEDRRLDRRAAYPSLFEFCRRKLGMSEGTANRRITAVRLARRMPGLVGHLQQGRVTLSALMLVKNVITEANVEDVVAKVTGKTQDQIEELVACMAPKADVPARLALLPTRADRAVPPADADAATESPRVPADPRARLAPLAEARWRLQLTADKALHDKIERVRELMRHRNPSGDLTVVVAAAVDALLEKLEAPRKERPPRRRRAIKVGAVAAATRSEVFARDGEQCTYRNEHGARCPSTTFLEIDHVDARARGGSGDLANLRVRCYAHNMLHAEDVFGRAHIEKRIQERRRRRSRPAFAAASADDPPRRTTNGRG